MAASIGYVIILVAVAMGSVPSLCEAGDAWAVQVADSRLLRSHDGRVAICENHDVGYDVPGLGDGRQVPVELSSPRAKAPFSVTALPMLWQSKECMYWVVGKALLPNKHFRPYKVLPFHVEEERDEAVQEGHSCSATGCRALEDDFEDDWVFDDSDESHVRGRAERERELRLWELEGMYGRDVTWAHYQGGGELLGLYAAELLGIEGKSPLAVLSLGWEDILYVSQMSMRNDSNGEWRQAEEYQLKDEEFIKRDLTHLRTLVAMPWQDGLHDCPPSRADMDLLRRPSFRDKLHEGDRRYLTDVSDALVLDFLLDDHDRFVRGNWRCNAAGRLLPLDSGGAFFFASPSCTHTSPAKSLEWTSGILCGRFPDGVTKELLWRDWRDNSMQYRHNCSPVCVFRRSTVETLRAWLRSPSSLGSTLQGRMDAALGDDMCLWSVWQSSQSRARYSFPDCSCFYDAVQDRLT